MVEQQFRPSQFGDKEVVSIGTVPNQGIFAVRLSFSPSRGCQGLNVPERLDG